MNRQAEEHEKEEQEGAERGNRAGVDGERGSQKGGRVLAKLAGWHLSGAAGKHILWLTYGNSSSSNSFTALLLLPPAPF